MLYILFRKYMNI